MMQALRRQTKFAPTSVRAPTWPISHRSEDDHVHRTHDKVNLPNGSPARHVTQEEQDEEDNEQKREAMRDLVESWMDRLQLISVITTFFASTEAGLLSLSAPNSDGTPIGVIAQLANIGIVGSLVVHSSAAIISFLGAFFLITYKLKVAVNEEKQAEKHDHIDEDKKTGIVESPTSMGGSFGRVNKDSERGEKVATTRQRKSNLREPIVEHGTDPIPGPIKVNTGTGRPVWSCNPHIVQVGPFQSHPPTHLVRRCHALCVVLTSVGFVLALMGILCFAWDRLPLSVSSSASVIMALCILSGLFILFKPYPPEGTSPNIYVFDEL